MVNLCCRFGDYEELEAVMVNMSKKRGILKLAITAMVQKCIEFIPTVSDMQKRIKLIETICKVTEGKIYVEVELARVTRMLVQIHEAAGRVKKAAQLIQELQVETFGSMERREKVDFILEQIRLSIAIDEFQKARIISRKVTAKTFEHEGFEDLKLRYLELMIQLDVREGKYIECCRHYMSIFGLTSINEEEEKLHLALKMAIIFAILAQYNNEQADMLNILNKERKVESLPLYRELLRTFLTKELIRWPAVEEAFGSELRSFGHLFGADDQSKVRWTHLNERVIEHNVRIIGGFYSTIRMNRFASLLDLSPEKAEQTLASLVSVGMVWAKVDRTTGIITFAERKSSDDMLNSWNSRVDGLLSLMVKTNHQIAKEEMIHSALGQVNGS